MKEYKYTINGNKYEISIEGIEDNIAKVLVNGEEYKVEMEKEPEPEKKKVVVKPVTPQPAHAASSASASPKANANNAVKAPLPGVIVEVKVAVGDKVKIGDTVVVLEAMKMANNLDTEKAGTVTAVLVQPGESVMEDTPLVVIE
ncbi:MAG: biotin/lipoyl-binding protein [Prevotella sp.]|nr:biotin/lipoyl-binding protein [Prevotella sp.]